MPNIPLDPTIYLPLQLLFEQYLSSLILILIFSLSSPVSSSIPFFFSLHCLLLVLFRFTRRWLGITGKRNYRWFLRSFNSIQRLYILCPVVVPSLPFTWRMTKTSTRKKAMLPQVLFSFHLWCLEIRWAVNYGHWHWLFSLRIFLSISRWFIHVYEASAGHIAFVSLMTLDRQNWHKKYQEVSQRSRPKGLYVTSERMDDLLLFLSLKHKPNCPALITRRSNQTHGLTSII